MILNKAKILKLHARNKSVERRSGVWLRTSKTRKNPQTQVAPLLSEENPFESKNGTILAPNGDIRDFEEFKDFPLEGGFIDERMGKYVVEARGFEPPTPASRTQCATGLRYASIQCIKLKGKSNFIL